ncbi:putative metalloprotease CJM1_0395 family protein [Colwellia sp. 1_MG-2023]|uniref:putative metalloprotease CJM1_0395 family protein n=1 Tax=Colwellia sp. 1_MG-2023 TaxID=3062649 RepID=UPI0026E433DC|nr:putative metalloprotease CJM1_0395 family protein [Colwellia sp. 1_MG-2023]MDO6445409.1 putative metalloprotease CJM1_0395 family protein [Colwellia sp. 1_MG-2023]
MNITPHTTATPIPTVVNPPTDALRRENNQREIITKPAAAQQSAAEKGVASERDRAKTPAQNNEQIDFENLRKQAELTNKTISDEEHGSKHEEDKHQQAFSDNIKEGQTAENQDDSENADYEKQESSREEIAEQKIINELADRDKEVRAHEMAHAAVGGSTTGAPSYSYETGPDGKKYVVDGEVSVDLSIVAGDPQATISKMQKVYAAALAPAQPSAQDLRVARSATKNILEAQSELAGLNSETNRSDQDGPSKLSGVESNQEDALHNRESDEFDQAMEKTLKGQEAVAPSRPVDIDQRALRIENFYSNINRAYEKQPSYQFELTA